MKFYFIITILLFTIGCTKKEKKILLETEAVEHFLNEYSLIIYDDSTYSETKLRESNNKLRNIAHIGKVRIKNDTLFFEEKIGILKNNHVEIIMDSIQMIANSTTESYKKELLKNYKFNEKQTIQKGKSSYRLKVKQSKLEIPNYFDSKKFNRYNQFYGHYSDRYDFEKFPDFKRINLSNNEMIIFDKALKNLFLNEESLKNLKIVNYFIQFIPIKTSKQEIYIIGVLSCDESRIKTSYISSMNDGGDCFIYFNLNLATGEINYKTT